MRLLITNDDGIDAPGLHVLARAMVKEGHDVTVAAPLVDMSGSGAAIGPVDLSLGIVVHRDDLPDLDGVDAYGVDGPPALAVLAARAGAFGEPPAVVVAGVNPGLNTGRSVLHSGTVGAALTAANFGASAVAVSQEIADRWMAETAATFAAAAVAWIAAQEPGAPTVLSLNVPNLPLEQVAGVRAARLAPFGTVRAALGRDLGGRRQLVLHDQRDPGDDDTDTALVGAGFVAVTSLVGVRAADDGLSGAPEAIAAGALGGR